MGIGRFERRWNHLTLVCWKEMMIPNNRWSLRSLVPYCLMSIFNDLNKFCSALNDFTLFSLHWGTVLSQVSSCWKMAFIKEYSMGSHNYSNSLGIHNSYLWLFCKTTDLLPCKSWKPQNKSQIWTILCCENIFIQIHQQLRFNHLHRICQVASLWMHSMGQ